MDNFKENLILGFLILNALFWGLFPHSSHCKVMDAINNFIGMDIKCPSHKVHLLMGFIFYALSVYYTQKESFKKH
tara:strand:+ start:92 stop:316 length:225 start_codon:yes stop_codon:yes gene_type:complete